MDFIEPCFGIGHNLSLICQMTSEDIKHQLIIIKTLWLYCPGHAGVKRNDRAYRLTVTSGLLLGKVLRSLRHYLRAQTQVHHTIDRLEERGVERGSAKRSSSTGREKAIVRRTLEPFPRQRWGKILRHRVGFSERVATILN